MNSFAPLRAFCALLIALAVLAFAPRSHADTVVPLDTGWRRGTHWDESLPLHHAYEIPCAPPGTAHVSACFDLEFEVVVRVHNLGDTWGTGTGGQLGALLLSHTACPAYHCAWYVPPITAWWEITAAQALEPNDGYVGGGDTTRLLVHASQSNAWCDFDWQAAVSEFQVANGPTGGHTIYFDPWGYYANPPDFWNGVVIDYGGHEPAETEILSVRGRLSGSITFES